MSHFMTLNSPFKEKPQQQDASPFAAHLILKNQLRDLICDLCLRQLRSLLIHPLHDS